jgi:hypothetical protein
LADVHRRELHFDLDANDGGLQQIFGARQDRQLAALRIELEEVGGGQAMRRHARFERRRLDRYFTLDVKQRWQLRESRQQRLVRSQERRAGGAAGDMEGVRAFVRSQERVDIAVRRER